MKRFPGTLVALSLLLTPVILLAAAPKSQPPKEQEVVKITLHPMAETRPALKYPLLPPFLDRRPGNAAVHWNRLSVERTSFFNGLYKAGGTWEKAEKWMAIPIGDPHEKEFRTKEPAIDQLLRSGPYSDMDYAARFESCDWELPLHQGHVFEMLVPEAQVNRNWGRLLAAKAHGEIIDKKYGDAVRTFQTGLALARHTAQGQTLVHGLVGTAVAAQTTSQIELFIQQPDAPNLYWSLAMLPRALIDYRPGYECEMNNVVLSFTYLQDLEKKNLGKEQWDELLGKLIRDYEYLGGIGITGGSGNASRMLIALNMVQGYSRAQQYLIDHGRKKAEVEAMPQAQVVLLYTMSLYEELRDDQFKAIFLPYPESKSQLERLDATLRDRGRQELIPLASLVLPALKSVKEAETRMPWIIARLRIFEALRIYAAAHDGQLPARLDDIREVPIPLNPFEDKPFTYQRDGARAMLSSESGPRNMPWRYEITMAVKAK